jgi:hypothetical protein
LAWGLAAALRVLPGAPAVTGRLLFAAVTGLTTWPLYALARQLGASARTALLVALCWALASWPVLLGARGLSEAACALWLTSGVLLVVQRRAWLAAACLSVAVMLRLQCALVPLVAVPWALVGWPRREAGKLLGGLAVGALAFGVLDAVMWGDLFHSAKVYVRFNWLEGGAATFGVEPASYYVVTAARALGGVLAVAAAALLAKGARWPASVVVVFLAAHLAQPHKELRFLLPVLPLVLALAGAGLARVPVVEKWSPLLVLVGLATQPMPWTMSYRMLGIPLEPQGGAAWDVGGSANRLLREAGRRAQVCGVMLRGQQLGYSGAYTWFHGAGPLFDELQPAVDEAQWNALIAPAGAVGEVLASDGAMVLVLVRPTCVVGAYDSRLK